MSKKSELINIIKAYMENQGQLYNKIIEINKTQELTDVGKEQRIKSLETSFQGVAQNAHDKAIGMLDSGIKTLEDKWKANTAGKLLDSNYQIGLANTIKMIETGAITDKEDFKNIIDVYKDDYNALATIRNLCTNLELAVLIHKDNRDYNRKLLNDLRNNIENSINPFIVKDSVSLSLESMIQFIDTRFKDDFTVIPWEEVQ